MSHAFRSPDFSTSLSSWTQAKLALQGDFCLREEPMVKHASNVQQDLFEETLPAAPLPPADRAKALEQLQALLTEAITTPTHERERGDEQDHS
jgi:hypothetical protein